MSGHDLEHVQTPRLALERLRAEHADELAQLLQDPRVARTLSPGGAPPSDRDIRTALVNKDAHWERMGFGFWIARDRESGEMLGQGGLQCAFCNGASEVEAAWAIVPERWGRGLATELAHAAVDAAFDVLALGEVVAFTLAENQASRRVMDKTGFALEREITRAGVPHLLFRLRRRPRC